MGRASRRKLEARIQAAIRNIVMSQDKPPFWEKNLFWGPLGIGVGILLLVLAVMKDVRWVLFVAWPCLLISLWVATRDIQSSKKRVLAITCFVIVGVLGHFALHTWLAPESLSDAQLCSNSNEFAQRLREFDRERHLQHDIMDKQFMARINEAKTEDEKRKLGEERSASYSRWHESFNYELRERFIPQGLYLRHQLLSRLPQQPVGTVLNDEATFRNIGPNAIFAAANRIEVLAREMHPDL